MYYRRKILINLIRAFGEQGIEKLRLQKILFQLCKGEQNPAFDFVLYEGSKVSFLAQKDLTVLCDHYKILDQNKEKWMPNKNTPTIELRDKEKDKINLLVNQNLSSLDATCVEQSKRNVRYPSPTKKQEQKVLFTIGYEGKSIDAYLTKLVENKIRLLWDVRKNPISMKYGFSKSQLKNYCEKLDIDYCHIPELGIDSKKRKNLVLRNDYKTLFEAYKNSLGNYKKSLSIILERFETCSCMALTCFEGDSSLCHRHCISDHFEHTEGIVCHHI